MYGIYTNIWLICMVNVGKYTIVPWILWVLNNGDISIASSRSLNTSEETNVSGLPLLQLGVWDEPGRDPRGFWWRLWWFLVFRSVGAVLIEVVG